MKFEWDLERETNLSKKASVMKKEYDFTNAKQGKFYRPIEELDIPIYLEPEIKKFFIENLKNRKDNNFSLNVIINALIKQGIEISKKLAYYP